MKDNNNNLSIKKLLTKWLLVVVLLSLLLLTSILPIVRCAQIIDLGNDLSATISATSNDNILDSNNFNENNKNINNNNDGNNNNNNKSSAFLLLVSANQIATLGLNIPHDEPQIIYKQKNEQSISNAELIKNENSSSIEFFDADIHLQKNYLFVTDSSGAIRRFELVPPNQNELANELVIYNSSSMVNNNNIKISVDWSQNLLYVAEQFGLFSMDLNGDDVTKIIDDFSSSNKPECIRVDPKSGYIFWLTKGNFTNTIYSFSLQQHKSNKPFSSRDAIPIIQDLPSSIELFLIDYRLSRIYVPFPNTTTTKIFAIHHHDGDLSKTIHSDDLYNHHLHHSSEILVGQQEEKFGGATCDYKNTSNAKIMAYNFDGTDRGPVRHKGNVYTASIFDDFDHLLDVSIDEEGYFYWLAKPDVISKEYRDSDECYHHIGDNYEDKEFKFNRMLLASSSRQPMIQTAKSMTNKTQSATRSIHENQHQLSQDTLSDTIDLPVHKSLPESLIKPTDTIFNSSTSFTIVSFFVLLMGFVIIIGLLIKKRSSSLEQTAAPSARQTDLDRYNTGSGATDSCINHSRNTVDDASSRYYRPSTINTGTSYDGDHLAHIAIESGSSATNNFERDTSGHLNHPINTAITYDTGLATTNRWPINGNESNNLYVPAEVLQDEVLASIPRLTIDQLNIEKNACLGSGFFGTVYIGTVVERGHHRQNNSKLSINRNRHSQLRDRLLSASTVAHIVESENGSYGEQIMTPSALSVASSFTPTPVSSSCSTSSSSAIINGNNNNHSYVNSNVCRSSSICTPSGQTSGEGYLTPIHYNCDCQIIVEDNKRIINNCDEQHVKKQFKNTATSSTCYYDLSAATTVNSDSQQLVEKLTSLGSNNENFTRGQLKVAIKRLKDDAGEDDRRDFLQEAKLLASCRHDNIVTLLGICLDRGSTLIIMELMAGGDLQKYLQERRPKSIPENSNMALNEVDLISICLDIVNGLCYLEQRRFVHRDLAARNCLVSSIIRKDRVVKISDFGLARDIYQSDYYINKGRRPVPARWLAPECLSDNRYTTKSDVWSFGVLMWEIMTFCQRPYADIDIGNGSDECRKLKDFLRTGKRLARPDLNICCNEM